MRHLLHVSLISISHESTSNNQLQGNTNEHSSSRKCHYHILQQSKWQSVQVNFVFVATTFLAFISYIRVRLHASPQNDIKYQLQIRSAKQTYVRKTQSHKRRTHKCVSVTEKRYLTPFYM
jgi:hypothetical protein